VTSGPGARTMLRVYLVVAAAVAITLAVLYPMDAVRARGKPLTPAPRSRAGEWSAYGRDALGSRYSPLARIDRANVSRLAVAWTFRTGEMDSSFATANPAKLEATPLMVGGTLYFATPLGRVFALDPSTGRQRWLYDAGVNRSVHFGDFASRGVSTWVDQARAPGAPCRRRIFVATIDARLIALDAHDGAPCRDFGARGTVNLRKGLHNAPFEESEYEVTSPPAVVGNLVVVGSGVADNNRIAAASGEVRAYDARSGARRWSWDPVPRDSADPAWASWRGPLAHNTGAANAWSVLAADTARDLVFVPTGSASPDYFGGERLGDNHYANSIVALRASTGRVVWHFQAVHHDLWDYDLASPPALVTITRAGRRVDAVLQATKSGQLFVLDRDSGRPLFPVEERAVPTSTIAGEESAPTQPFNTVLPPLSPLHFDSADMWGVTDADRASCRAQIRGLRNDGPYAPPSEEGTLVVPSNAGGAHWGGVAYDPVRQIAVVPVNHLAAVVQLIPLGKFDRARSRETESRLGDQYTRMHGTPYVVRRRILRAPSGLPCTPPPFGSLVAIDLRSGARLWDVPLGSMSPAVAALGSPNFGGPIITAGGIVFIGASIDHAIHAFDIETGRLLWSGPLPAGARATPMTYQLTARSPQYLVIAVGGAELWGRGDYIVAFALPH
jgi:quinoprotein glucose dehydrogenase